MAPRVLVHDYKRIDLQGGTLVVSVPHTGMGGNLLTDFVLEQHEMDQLAAVVSTDFPPLALVREGKARFPARIHADAHARVALLRCEFSPPLPLVAPMAAAILDWAGTMGIARIVTLDGLQSLEPDQVPEGVPPLHYVGAGDVDRGLLEGLGVLPLERGAIGGVPAMLLLDGRLRGANVISLYAVVRSALDDARSVLAFAHVLHRLVPGLRVDEGRLDRELSGLEQAVRAVREEAEQALERMVKAETPSPSPAYG